MIDKEKKGIKTTTIINKHLNRKATTVGVCRLDGDAGGHVPHDNVLVEAGAGQNGLVARIRQTLDVVVVGAQRVEQRAALRLPHLDGGVARGREEHAGARAHHHVVHPVGVIGQRHVVDVIAALRILVEHSGGCVGRVLMRMGVWLIGVLLVVVVVMDVLVDTDDRVATGRVEAFELSTR